MKRYFWIFLCWCCFSLPMVAQDLHLLPQPQTVQLLHRRNFVLSPRTPLSFDPSLAPQAQYLHDLILQSTGFDLPLASGGRKGIVLRTDAKISSSEGYRLRTEASRVDIAGKDAAGVFYGIQTLLQLLPPEIFSARLQTNVAWTAPAVDISDAPNRPWRGMMLDVARYFYDADFVKRYIDLMAHYKLNKLQLHLIDDSGWRLEIKRYPRLTEVGAWAGSKIAPLGGFYTQAEMRDIISYGKVRGVEIIPEIEFPAHILSAVVAYPWLSCNGKQHEMPTQHFISRDLLCPGKDSSMEFLQNVLDEVVALFPSPIINIGGDEAIYDHWENCPHCRALMEREGITKTSDLQGWLTNRVAKMMGEKNRTCMGWEEIILRGKIDKPVLALIWHNEADSIEATKTGHKAVLTPASHLYFDFPEQNLPGEVQAATWMPPVSLEKVYSLPFNDYSEKSTVLGAQGSLWSDQFIHGTKLQELAPLDENRSECYAEYLTFPRLLALSEICWLPLAQRSWERFSAATAFNYRRLDALDVHYRMPTPAITKVEQHNDFSATFTLAPATMAEEIVYTTDGSQPHRHSPRYTQPLRVENPELFRAAYLHGRRVSLPTLMIPDYSRFSALGEFVAQQRNNATQTTQLTEKFDLTGKIRSNGRYRLHFVVETASPNSTTNRSISQVEVWKRDERIATAGTTTANNVTSTAEISINNFEAGTPFSLRLHREVGEGKTQLLIFLQKL